MIPVQNPEASHKTYAVLAILSRHIVLIAGIMSHSQHDSVECRTYFVQSPGAIVCSCWVLRLHTKDGHYYCNSWTAKFLHVFRYT